jgi:hypothetical protein
MSYILLDDNYENKLGRVITKTFDKDTFVVSTPVLSGGSLIGIKSIEKTSLDDNMYYASKLLKSLDKSNISNLFRESYDKDSIVVDDEKINALESKVKDMEGMLDKICKQMSEKLVEVKSLDKTEKIYDVIIENMRQNDVDECVIEDIVESLKKQGLEDNSNVNEIFVMFDDGRRACYSYAELDQIVLSYAITIHKSQGSEFPVVIIPVMGGNPLLMNKNLLYTAVTRAKKMVVLIGKSTNVYYMIMNKSSAVRHTMLESMLKKIEIDS